MRRSVRKYPKYDTDLNEEIWNRNIISSIILSFSFKWILIRARYTIHLAIAAILLLINVKGVNETDRGPIN